MNKSNFKWCLSVLFSCLMAANAMADRESNGKGGDGDASPPVITDDAPAVLYNSDVTALVNGRLPIQIDIEDDTEISYYRILEHAQAGIAREVIVDPETALINLTIDLVIRTGVNQLKLLAVDMSGNTTKSWIEVTYDTEEPVDCTNFRSNANLDGCDLTGIDLSGYSLHQITARLTIFDNANLAGTSFSESMMTGASLIGADLVGADLTGVTLQGANIVNADLSDANLYGAYLVNADFTGATLERAQYPDYLPTFLVGTNFTNANLRYADLSGFALTDSGLNLTGADLTGATVSPSPAAPWQSWVGLTCPDGTAVNADDGDGSTCNSNLIPAP